MPRHLRTTISVLGLLAALGCQSPTGGGDAPSPAASADLKQLAVSAGTLSPVFRPEVTQYALTVDSTVTSVTISGTPADTQASVTGPKVVSNLVIGTPVTATLTVTGADQATKKDYRVTVTRAAAPAGASDASLKYLTPSYGAGTLKPSFQPSVTSYSLEVEPLTTEVTFTATPTNAGATVALPPTVKNLVAGVAQTADNLR